MKNSLLVALSAGGKNDELSTYGLGVEHVEELMVRLAMSLLRNGHRLAFGGSFGVPNQRLTEILIDTTQSWIGEASAKACKITRPQTWPLVNYSAWPYYNRISDEQRATLVGICRFVNVDTPKVSKSLLTPNTVDLATDPQARLFAADGLSKMRQKSAREADFRIVWGGSVFRAAGWMAGILEEFTYSCEFEKPVLVLGGFGGCARLIADFLSNRSNPWPDQLSLAACADADRDKLQSDSHRNDIQALFKRTQTQLTDFRKKLHNQEQLYGIPTKILRDALTEESPRKVIRLAAKAAKACVDARSQPVHSGNG